MRLDLAGVKSSRLTYIFNFRIDPSPFISPSIYTLQHRRLHKTPDLLSRIDLVFKRLQGAKHLFKFGRLPVEHIAHRPVISL